MPIIHCKLNYKGCEGSRFVEPERMHLIKDEACLPCAKKIQRKRSRKNTNGKPARTDIFNPSLNMPKQNALCPHRSECLKQAAKSSTFRPDCENCKFGNVKEDLSNPFAATGEDTYGVNRYAAANVGGVSL
jgi:hypothetical protein